MSVRPSRDFAIGDNHSQRSLLGMSVDVNVSVNVSGALRGKRTSDFPAHGVRDHGKKWNRGPPLDPT
jgi:hypothetical protein